MTDDKKVTFPALFAIALVVVMLGIVFFLGQTAIKQSADKFGSAFSDFLGKTPITLPVPQQSENKLPEVSLNPEEVEPNVQEQNVTKFIQNDPNEIFKPSPPATGNSSASGDSKNSSSGGSGSGGSSGGGSSGGGSGGGSSGGGSSGGGSSGGSSQPEQPPVNQAPSEDISGSINDIVSELAAIENL